MKFTRTEDLLNEFKEPGVVYAPRPLWFWNGTPTTSQINEIMENSAKLTGYGGFGILPYDYCELEYMSEVYMDRYEDAVKKAGELGLKMCIYDEWGFPSGSAGGLLKEKYPEYCAKRLDKFEQEVQGPSEFKSIIPDGKLMGVVAMEKENLKCIDITDFAQNGEVSWQVPSGNWRVMIFVCVLSGWDRVDYLNPEAVKKFVELTHDKYYQRLGEYFGTVIDSTFYDEPIFAALEGRTWTESFNDKFIERYGYSPVKFYPAMWYDIGDNTHSARNALYGFRAELYSEGFPKVIQDWCTKHGIRFTGHIASEEPVNPVEQTGDLMKSFKYQEIPGLDEIFEYGRGQKMYKVVTSAAYNWDYQLIMTETFGGMGAEIDPLLLYKETMDQYAKGVNFMVPHAVWLDDNPEKIQFPPELSYRNNRFSNELVNYNKYTSRLNVMLQRGRHVADIGVLYPIASLQAAHYFDAGAPYEGHPIPDDGDYLDIGEKLFYQARRDYTFVHPEVLDEKCIVKGNEICLENNINFENYKVFIIPGSRCISLSNIKKIKEFYDNGGTVIATCRLPYTAVEFGENLQVCSIVREMFGLDDPKIDLGYRFSINNNGGKAYYIPDGDINKLISAIDAGINIPDVFLPAGNPTDMLGYIHKVYDNRHYYFFANSTDVPFHNYVELRGELNIECWNPYNGEVSIPHQNIMQGKTRVNLELDSADSIFLVSK